MSKEDKYTQDEVREMLGLFGTELRDGNITEVEFRMRVSRLGFNATDSDELVNEAMKPT